MTLDDLHKTLTDALATGKIGTPVSLRLHLQLVDPSADLAGSMATVMRIAEAVFDIPTATLSAQRDAGERQLNVLIESASGQTVSLTIGRGCTDTSKLDLLLVGNHGIVRLGGTEHFDEASLASPASASEQDGRDWQVPLETCFGTNKVVRI